MNSKWLIGLGVTIVALALLWITAPVFHWLWFDLFYLNPTFWVLFVLLVAMGLIAISERLRIMAGIGAIVICILMLGYTSFSGAIADRELVMKISPTKISRLPDTKGIRYLPFEVAEAYARSKMNDPAYAIGDLDPLDAGESLYYVAPRVPNGLWNSLTRQTDGVMIIKPDGQVDVVHQLQTYGEGMIVTDHILWALFSTKYWIEVPEAYYTITKDEVLTMAPYVTYRFVFPVMIPEWGGVFVVHPDGQIEDLSPKQAMNDPRFAEQRLYPEALAKRIGQGWQYRGGILNALFIHRDQTEFPTINNSKNQMPYLLPTDPNPTWFVALEPSGPSYSVYKMLLTDAHTGQVSLYEVSPEMNLLGPNKAVEFVKAAFPTTQWYKAAEKGGAGTIIAIEPKPITRGNVLYWQVSITNLNYAGVTRTAIINADNQKVVYVESVAELESFIAGKFAGRTPDGQITGVEPTKPAPGSQADIDLSKYSDTDLLRLLQRVAEELNRRQRK